MGDFVTPDVAAGIPRMTLKENVLMRLIGLFILLAPNRGAAFLADVHIRTADRVAAREAKERSLAA